MIEKFKVKFLTVIWGDRYIEEFARVALPSYLAACNLPALATETDLEALVSTSRDSCQKFEEEPVFAKLRRLCPVRYIFIDDLVTTGNYGVTFDPRLCARDTRQRAGADEYIFRLHELGFRPRRRFPPHALPQAPRGASMHHGPIVARALGDRSPPANRGYRSRRWHAVHDPARDGAIGVRQPASDGGRQDGHAGLHYVHDLQPDSTGRSTRTRYLAAIISSSCWPSSRKYRYHP